MSQRGRGTASRSTTNLAAPLLRIVDELLTDVVHDN